MSGGAIIPIGLPLAGRSNVNAILLLGDPLTLVDTGLGNPASLAALRVGLAEHGLSVRHLEQIVITHAHLDHFGAAEALRRESGARVLGDAAGATVMADFHQDWVHEHAYRVSLYAAAGAPAALLADARTWADSYGRQGESVVLDQGIAPGETVVMGGRQWRAIAVPGHAPSSLAFHSAEDNLLLSGDVLIGTGAANVTLHRVGDGQLPVGWQLTIVESLRRLAALDARRAFPGHGATIEEPAATIADRIGRVEARLAQVLSWLDDPLTAYEVSLRLYEPPTATTWVGLAAAVGYVDALERRGQVRVVEVDGVRRYQRAAHGSAVALLGMGGVRHAGIER